MSVMPNMAPDKPSYESTSFRHQTPSNILEAHMIWPDTGSHLSSSLLQPHLPPGSSLNTHTLLPSCICTGGSSAWRAYPPRCACGHSFMSFTSLLKYHLLHEAHTDHPSKTATFPGPTRLYSGSPFSEHLPISRQTLPSLIRLTLPPSPEHTA